MDTLFAFIRKSIVEIPQSLDESVYPDPTRIRITKANAEVLHLYEREGPSDVGCLEDLDCFSELDSSFDSESSPNRSPHTLPTAYIADQLPIQPEERLDWNI